MATIIPFPDRFQPDRPAQLAALASIPDEAVVPYEWGEEPQERSDLVGAILLLTVVAVTLALAGLVCWLYWTFINLPSMPA